MASEQCTGIASPQLEPPTTSTHQHRLVQEFEPPYEPYCFQVTAIPALRQCERAMLRRYRSDSCFLHAVLVRKPLHARPPRVPVTCYEHRQQSWGVSAASHAVPDSEHLYLCQAVNGDGTSSLSLVSVVQWRRVFH